MSFKTLVAASLFVSLPALARNYTSNVRELWCANRAHQTLEIRSVQYQIFDGRTGSEMTIATHLVTYTDGTDKVAKELNGNITTDDSEFVFTYAGYEDFVHAFIYTDEQKTTALVDVKINKLDRRPITSSGPIRDMSCVRGE